MSPLTRFPVARSDNAGWRVSCLLSATALFLITAIPVGTAPADRPSIRDAPQHAGFVLSPGTCEQGPEFCGLTTPRAWAPGEIALITDALDEIAAATPASG